MTEANSNLGPVTPGLGQAQTSGGVKLAIHGVPNLSSPPRSSAAKKNKKQTLKSHTVTNQIRQSHTNRICE